MSPAGGVQAGKFNLLRLPLFAVRPTCVPEADHRRQIPESQPDADRGAKAGTPGWASKSIETGGRSAVMRTPAARMRNSNSNPSGSAFAIPETVDDQFFAVEDRFGGLPSPFQLLNRVATQLGSARIGRPLRRHVGTSALPIHLSGRACASTPAGPLLALRHVISASRRLGRCPHRPASTSVHCVEILNQI